MTCTEFKLLKVKVTWQSFLEAIRLYCLLVAPATIPRYLKVSLHHPKVTSNLLCWAEWFPSTSIHISVPSGALCPLHVYGSLAAASVVLLVSLNLQFSPVTAEHSFNSLPYMNLRIRDFSQSHIIVFLKVKRKYRPNIASLDGWVHAGSCLNLFCVWWFGCDADSSIGKRRLLVWVRHS